MSRPRLAVLVLLAAGFTLALGAFLFLDQPARPRPAGWKQPWERLPLEPERQWAVDGLKRGVVQASFFNATDHLTDCLQHHGGPEGALVKLELLVETEQGGTHLEYVEAEPRTDLPAGLMPCVTRALEAATPVPTPRLLEGTHWRLEVGFLVPPLADLPRAPWWKRLLPERWRQPRSGGSHVG